MKLKMIHGPLSAISVNSIQPAAGPRTSSVTSALAAGADTALRAGDRPVC